MAVIQFSKFRHTSKLFFLICALFLPFNASAQNIFGGSFGDFPSNSAYSIWVQDNAGYFGDVASPPSVESALEELGASHTVVDSTYARLDGANQPFTDDVWLLESDLSASNVIVTGTASAPVVDTQFIENSRNGAVTVRDDLAVDGTITGSFGLTEGSVPFANATGALTEDNANLYWDNVNKRLGIGTTSPDAHLEVETGAVNQQGIQVISTSDLASGRADRPAIHFQGDDTEVWRVGTQGGGNAGYFNIRKTTAITGAALTAVTITPDGNVGINDTTPDAKLEVLSTTDPIQRWTNTDNVDALDLFVDTEGDSFFTPTSGNFWIGDGSDVDYVVGWNGNTTQGTMIWNEDLGYFSISGNDLTNCTKIEADGTIEFQGTATVFRDINFAIATLTKGAAAPDLIDFAGSSIEVLGFDGAAITEEVSGTTELDHFYKEGSNITAHIHWTPINGNGGNVKWQLEYTWFNPEGTFNAGQTITATTAAGAVAWDERRTDFPVIDGTGMLIESQFVFRIFRDPTDDADTYGSDAASLTFGLHVEMDTIGSRAVLTK